MVKIAFWYDSPETYSGGINYLRNLLIALKSVNNSQVVPVIYFGKTFSKNYINDFKEFATVKTTSTLDRKSTLWYINKISCRIFSCPIVQNLIFKKDGIKILTHAKVAYKWTWGYKQTIWIPDFQAMHLPHLFPGFDKEQFDRRILDISKYADSVILSSIDAQRDFVSITGDKIRSEVLQFVSQPNPDIFQSTSSGEALNKKYSISDKYFYMPNQFWQHKNHLVVFKAVKYLKSQGIDIELVCTGNPVDFRTNTTDYFDSLVDYISENSLSNNIKCLGFIDYNEVLFLTRNAIAIINPSLFEGWSSTVEEAKSIGKRMLLSDLPVHLEQNPRESLFFDRNNSTDLADKMSLFWREHDININKTLEEKAKQSLGVRTNSFGKTFEDIIFNVLGS